MRWQIIYICSVLAVLASGQGEPDPIVSPDDPVVPETEAPIDPVAPEEPSVIIAQGTVVGSVAQDGDYLEFYGIPYADSTSGAHRFKAPLPPPSFQDTFIANRRDIKCVRALGVGFEGTEDCLVANIFTPTIDRTSQLPVMVWIKGREFDKQLEQELSFKNFVEKDVVVVSLNYRESILGFLCLGTETAPGNAGLKDIVAGLRWVQENIAQFGGNPNDITLFGHGSGAAAVDLVTLSPMANGLVSKAIAQSGNAMAPWAVSRDNLEYAVQVAEALGHIVTDIQELSQVFTRTSVSALMAAINDLDLTENALAFAPCVEKPDLEGVNPFLTKTPSEIISDGEFLQIPFITGFVDNEGTIRSEEAVEDDWLERMDESFSEFLQSDLKFENAEQRTEVATKIREYYFENDPIDFTTVNDYLAYHGETMVLVSSIREVRARAQVSSASTYLYQFSYKGALGEPFVGPLDVETAAHSEELAYMFYSTPEGASDRDLTISDILIERWTNFAKTGRPSSDISQEIWQPFSNDSPFYLRVLSSEEITNTADASLEIVLLNPHPETLTFWNEIYAEHFLDAESNWSLTERNEDDDENGDNDSNEVGGSEGDSNAGNSNEDNSNEGDSNENGDNGNDGNEGDGGDGDDNNGDGDSVENEDNSASTAVGYTFLIVTLFSVLSKFHNSQLIN